jgi:hypothetical protein
VISRPPRMSIPALALAIERSASIDIGNASPW